jgi:hypothetical protein
VESILCYRISLTLKVESVLTVPFFIFGHPFLCKFFYLIDSCFLQPKSILRYSLRTFRSPHYSIIYPPMVFLLECLFIFLYIYYCNPFFFFFTGPCGTEADTAPDQGSRWAEVRHAIIIETYGR